MKIFVQQITINNPCDPTRDPITYLGSILYTDPGAAVSNAKAALGDKVLRVEVLSLEAEPVAVYDTQVAPEAAVGAGI
jgi:hypothetical protein